MNAEYPELYSLNNWAQREWAERVLNVFSSTLGQASIAAPTIGELGDDEAVAAAAAAEAETESRFNSVIDFGCGTGEITVQMMNRIWSIDNARSGKG